MTTQTPSIKQQRMVEDFIKVALDNGAFNIWAYLPRSHKLFQYTPGKHDIRQIRVLKDELAMYKDELGNLIVLTSEGVVKQMI